MAGRLQRTLDGIATPDGSPIEAWRRRILAVVLLTLCVLGGFAYVVGATAAYRSGEITVVVVDTLVYGLLVGITLAPRLPYTLRAAIVTVVPGLLGAYFLFGFGFVAAGFPWLMTFPIFASVLLGMRAGLRALAAMAVALVALGLLIPANVMPWTAAMPTAQTMWWVSSSSVLTLAGLVAVSTGYLFDGLGREAEARQAAEREADRRERLAALGTLTGGIAHDFNNLLQPIVSDAEHAQRLLPPEHDATPLLDDILRSASRARTLVRRILAFARPVPTGQHDVVDLAAVIGESERLLRAVLPPNVQLVTSLAEETHVSADAAELQQVLLNLVSNAAHAMVRGGTVTIELVQVSGGPHFDGTVLAGVPRLALLSVSDTGSGMSRETLARAFEPFFTTRHPGQGTGLGLATVHATISAHGGMILADSTPGRGTRMQVWLPLAAAAPRIRPGEPNAAVTLPATPRAHIVIVDDEPAVLQAAARLIERFGHQVTRFDSPNGLLAQFGELEPPPSLVLTDLSMPGINGWELARALRARHPAVPVVVMTGNLDLASESADGVAMAARSDRAPHPDVADVLGKPFTAAELRAVLERCLP